MKIGLFGGALNPIHYGHLRPAEEARHGLGLDRVIFIPSGNPPLKSEDLAPAEQRVKMALLAIRGNPAFEVSDIECSGIGKSYTVETVRTFRKERPDDYFVFILGSDAFADLHLWKEPDALASLIDFCVLSRPGFDVKKALSSPFVTGPAKQAGGGIQKAGLKGGRDVFFLDVTMLGISATDIRRRAREGVSIKYLLPESVESYIIANNLYAP